MEGEWSMNLCLMFHVHVGLRKVLGYAMGGRVVNEFKSGLS